MVSIGVLGQAAAGGSPWSMIFMVAAFIAIFYFMLWRPQQKQAKSHREMLAALKKGDAVVAVGGIVGRVHAIAEKYIVLEVGRDLRIRVLRSAVNAKAPPEMFEAETIEGSFKE